MSKSDYHRDVLDPPDSIVRDGRYQMGTYRGAIENLNILDAPSPLGRRLPGWINALRLKEWQAFQLSNEDWFICIAVYDTKSLGTAIIMAFEKGSGRLYRYEHKVPTWRLHVSRGLSDSHCFYHSRKLSLDFHNRLSADEISIQVKAKGFRGLPDFSGQWTAHHRTEPIVIVQPFAPQRPLYSHKALMPLEGTLEFGGDVSEFAVDKACAIVDDHKGFYPYVMAYDWVTALGHTTDGALVGFNLTDNQIIDPERFNENCLWTDGKMIPLPPIKVDRPQGVDHTWEIRDQYGQVDLTFTPLADVPNRLNVGLVRIDYHGPTGVFQGNIHGDDGVQVCIDEFIGMGESKYIRM